MQKTDPKKPHFPSKTCPGCSALIHARSKSHADCGWQDSSSTVAATKATPVASAAVKPMSKMDAVRRVLLERGPDTMPVEIQQHLKKQFKVKMDPSVISNYKRIILKEGAKKKPASPKPQVAGQARMPPAGITIDDVHVVKRLAERIGVDQLRQLAEVLAQ